MTVQIQRPSGINVGVSNPGNAIFISGRGLFKGDLRIVKNIVGASVDMSFEEATLNVASPDLQVWRSNVKMNRNSLRAQGEIIAELSSFLLGEQHTIASGGRNVFFRDNTDKIDYYPIWGGIKDQTVIANQDATGLVAPFARIYGDFLSTIEINGPVDTSGVVDYIAQTTVPLNISIHANEIIIEQTVNPTDVIFYSIFEGFDDTGVKVYQQKLTGLSFVAGDTFKWDFIYPLEGRAGNETFITMEISTTGGDGTRVPVKARRSSTQPTKPYATLSFRSFEDKDISLSTFDEDTIVTAAGAVVISGGNVVVSAP